MSYGQFMNTLNISFNLLEMKNDVQKFRGHIKLLIRDGGD